MPGLLGRMKEMGWFLQIQCEHDDLTLALPLIGRSGVRLIIDHFGRPDVQLGVDQPGFAALLELGRSGKAIVKLSGPFRSSRQAFPYADVDPFVAAVIDAFTLEQCVWGSDWPFVMLDQRLDYGPTLRCLSRWLPDARDRQRVLVDNPAALYGF